VYLAKKFNSDMAPKGLQEQALMDSYAFWVMCEVEVDALRILFAAIGRVHPDYLDGGGPEKVASNISRPMKAFEAWITGKEYLVGDRFTVADLNVASVMDWLVKAKYNFSPYPNTKAWLDKCLSRPANNPPKKSRL
jgi:glutathione S-transferase